MAADVWSAAFGDFNEDGRADVVYQSADALRNVLLNRGGGAFEPSKDRILPAGTPLDVPALVGADDVNGDGHLDLLFRGLSNTVSVALGRGHAQFDPLITSPVTFSGSWYDYADIDGDGRKDFIDFDRGKVTVELSTGDGKFAPSRTLVQPFGYQNFEFAIGDFDGDGFIDIYTAALSSDPHAPAFHQTFWWNDGKTGFPTNTELVTQFVVPTNQILDAYDFDGDGAADLLLRDVKTGAIKLMSGRNRQIALRSVEISDTLRAVGVWRLSGLADFDGDGRRDALFQNGVVVWGAPAGSPIEGTQFDLITTSATSGADNRGAQIADMNGDGIADIVGSGGGNGLFVVFGKRDTRRLAGGVVSSGGTTSRDYALGDINGDGLPDIVGEEEYNNLVTVHFADGRGGFAPQGSQKANSLSVTDSHLGLVDLDHDGFADLVFGNPAQVAFGNGSGAFAPPIKFDDARMIGGGRIDASGSAAAFIATAANVEILTFNAARTPSRTAIFPLPPNARVLAGDVDGDGITDLLIDTATTTQIIKKMANGWAVAAQLPPVFHKRTVGWFAVGDLNGDGRKDLVTCDGSDCDLSVATAGGYLPAVTPFHSSGFVRGVAVVDVDQDGRLDLVMLGAGNLSDPILLVISRNAGGGSFEQAGAADVVPATCLFAEDVDGDGDDDLVLFTLNGIEVLHNDCAPPRLHVAVVSSGVKGTTATVIVNASAAYTSFPGLITLREGSKELGRQQPFNPTGVATFSVPLQTTGHHVYTVAYDEQYLGHIEETVSIDVDVPPSRHHTARH